ncbi:MAG: HEPN domain-containing protein [Bacteroidales bacterium]|nr:HEPN domain-containing protein [Bacteroidales bacterium]
MGLTETDRKEVVKYRLERAKSTLAEVPFLMENEFYGTAINRLYYACYYATTALLVSNGHEAHTHTGVKTLLALHYIKEGLIEKSLGKMYGQLFNMRQTSDYEDWITLDESDVKQFIEPTEQFISAIENLISSQP